MKRSRSGMGSIYLKRGVHYILYRRDGKKFQERGGTKAEAQTLLKKRLAEVVTKGSDFIGPKADKVTVHELLDGLVLDYRLKKLRSLVDLERCRLSHLRAYFPKVRKAKEVTSAVLKAYALHRQSEGAADATINREYAALRRAYRLAVEESPPRLERVPKFPMLTENNVRKGFLEEADFLRLRTHLTPQIRLIVDLAYTFGMRKQEVLGLRWNQVDLKGGSIRLEVGETKTGDGRILPLTPALLADLRAHRSAQKTIAPDVFTVTDYQLRNEWDLATRAVGQRGLLLHDMRRSAIRNLRRRGVDRTVIKRLSGHRTDEVFERYNIVDERDLRDAIATLALAVPATK